MEYHRHSIRLKDFDYSGNGYYFVTICVQNKFNLFWNDGNIINVGVDRCVDPIDIPNHFKNIKLDEFIIMPDHIHFILIIDNYFKINRAYLGRTHRSARTLNQINKIVGVDRCVDPMKNEK